MVMPIPLSSFATAVSKLVSKAPAAKRLPKPTTLPVGSTATLGGRDEFVALGPRQQHQVPQVVRFVKQVRQQTGLARPNEHHLSAARHQQLVQAVHHPDAFVGIVRDPKHKALKGSIALFPETVLTNAQKSTKVGILTNFYVSPHYQSQGVGRWMLQTMLDEAKKRHYDRVLLYTSNQDLIAYYLKRGFQPADPQKNATKRLQDALTTLYTPEDRKKLVLMQLDVQRKLVGSR